MVRPRHSALIRTLTLLLLLWVGIDLGAHGLFASDFTPVATTGSCIRLCQNDGGATAPVAPDHCFCHGIYVGAVVPTPTAGLAPGTLVLARSPEVPPSDPHPLERPPQLTA
jgi:hypothetical protein